MMSDLSLFSSFERTRQCLNASAFQARRVKKCLKYCINIICTYFIVHLLEEFNFIHQGLDLPLQLQTGQCGIVHILDVVKYKERIFGLVVRKMIHLLLLRKHSLVELK